MLCIVTQNRQFFHKFSTVPVTNKSLFSIICFCSTDTLVTVRTSEMPLSVNHQLDKWTS